MARDPSTSSDDGDGAQDASSGSFSKRLTGAFFKPAKAKRQVVPKPESEMTEQEKAAAIRQIDPLETKIGYLAAALVAIIGLIAFLPYVDDPHKSITQSLKRSGKTCPSGFKATVVKGVHDCTGPVVYSRSHWLVEMLVLLFFAAFIFAAVRIGRRSALAFATLLAGLAVEGTTGSIIGLAFVGAGGWMILRAWRVQRYGSTSAKNAATTAGSRPLRKKRGSPADTGSTPAPPQANKRYTPKAPPPKSGTKPSGSRYDATKTNGAKAVNKANGAKATDKRTTPPPG
jgi:hypothetical protein